MAEKTETPMTDTFDVCEVVGYSDEDESLCRSSDYDQLLVDAGILECELAAAEFRCALLTDALDHIKRVAYAGMAPTRRLDWITLRAKVALRGDEWTPGMREEPDNSRAETIAKNVKLRGRCAELQKRVEELEGKL